MHRGNIDYRTLNTVIQDFKMREAFSWKNERERGFTEVLKFAEKPQKSAGALMLSRTSRSSVRRVASFVLMAVILSSVLTVLYLLELNGTISSNWFFLGIIILMVAEVVRGYVLDNWKKLKTHRARNSER